MSFTFTKFYCCGIAKLHIDRVDLQLGQNMAYLNYIENKKPKEGSDYFLL